MDMCTPSMLVSVPLKVLLGHEMPCACSLRLACCKPMCACNGGYTPTPVLPMPA